MKPKIMRLLPTILVAVIVGILLVVIHPGFTGVVAADTFGYSDMSSDLLGPVAIDRPPAYPALIALAKALAGDQWATPMVLFQCLMVVIVAVLLMEIYRKVLSNAWIAIPAVLITVLAPGVLMGTANLLPELPLMFCVVVSWYCGICVLDYERAGLRQRRMYAVTSGIFSGLALWLKPAWLFGFAPLVGGVAVPYVVLKRTPRKAFEFACLMLVPHLVFYSGWQLFLISRYQQRSFSEIGAINLNIASMRAGLTKYAEGTPLYDYLNKSGLLPSALTLTWTDFTKFTALKDAITWSERRDPRFYQQIFSRNLIGYVTVQLRRVPNFFTTRPGGTTPPLFSNLSSTITRIYTTTYDWLWRPLMPFLLIVGIMVGLALRRTRGITFLSLLLISYACVTLVLLTY